MQRQRTAYLRGINIIEMMVTVAIVVILVGLGAPGIGEWIKNAQIRNTAESISSGLQMARLEALRRNASLSFYLTNDLSASCALSITGRQWIVTYLNSAGFTSKCNASFFNEAFPDTDTTNNPHPQILKKSSISNSGSTQVNASVNTIVFNAMGRIDLNEMSGVSFPITVDITNPSAGACKKAGTVRCMRVLITSGGQIRMCDTSLDSPDPRAC
jgi:type IV fimbrial biogenesis protein FimT